MVLKTVRSTWVLAPSSRRLAGQHPQPWPHCTYSPKGSRTRDACHQSTGHTRGPVRLRRTGDLVKYLPPAEPNPLEAMPAQPPHSASHPPHQPEKTLWTLHVVLLFRCGGSSGSRSAPPCCPQIRLGLTAPPAGPGAPHAPGWPSPHSCLAVGSGSSCSSSSNRWQPPGEGSPLSPTWR